jgi:hypothetical protein
MSIKISRFKQGFSVVPIAEDDFIQLKLSGQLAPNTIYCIGNRLYVRTTSSESLFIGVLERVAAFPPSPKPDRLYLNISTNEIAVFNGIAWEVTPVSSFALYQTAESEQYVAVFGVSPTGGSGDGGDGTVDPSISGRVTNLEVSVALIRSGVPFTLTGTSASAMVMGMPIGIDASGRFVPVTSGSKDEVMRYVGISRTNVSGANAQVLVQTDGVFTLPSFNWAPGLPVYIDHSTPALTQVDPFVVDYFHYMQEVGIAVSSNNVLLRRSNAVRLQ